jgi:hypothetical protein
MGMFSASNITKGACVVSTKIGTSSIILLDILAVVALIAGESKEPFLENGIFAIPQPQSQTEPLMIITYPRDSILTPAVGFGAR